MSGSPSPFGGYAPWIAQVVQHAASIDGRLQNVFWNDLTDEATAGLISNSSGSVTFASAYNAGVADMQTGTAGGGDAQVQNAGGNSLVKSALTEPWYVHARCMLTTSAPDTDMDIECVGLTDGNAVVAVGQMGAIGLDTLSILIKVVSPPALTTIASDVVAPVRDPADNIFDDFALCLHDVDGVPTLTGYLNRDPVCETTDLTNVLDVASHFFAFVSQGGGTVNRRLLVDNIATVVR